MNIKHDNFIGIYEGAMSPEYCQRAIQYFEDMDEAGNSVNRHQSDNTNRLNKDDQAIFSSHENMINLSGTKALSQELNNALWNSCMADYTDRYSSLKQIANFGSYVVKIQRTKVGQGYHIWHFENPSPQMANRILAWMLYLNDVEEGGETEFLYQHKRVKPKTGTMLIWPAGFTHSHRGNPPLSNTKYIITGWVEL
jgi:hypothetical protein